MSYKINILPKKGDICECEITGNKFKLLEDARIEKDLIHLPCELHEINESRYKDVEEHIKRNGTMFTKHSVFLNICDWRLILKTYTILEDGSWGYLEIKERLIDNA